MYSVRSESPEKISLSINDLVKYLSERYGGEYARVGLSVVWSLENVMIKTVIESVSAPHTLLPGLYEFKLIVEGVNGEKVAELSKAAVTIFRKYELLINLSG
ncbi:MAG: hypothetical protein RMH77_06390 [Sulfolobales archaeon]|nr:hypothetical protein [Sulfolobales archaeon]MCX8185511.1 hypothetical protein [Sulfolobales archaeon]MDW7970010.1 hypothetical protein [Sulfolobales archaeon]